MKNKLINVFFGFIILLVILSLLREFYYSYYDKVFTCFVSLILIVLIRYIQSKLKVKFEMYLEVLTYIFIFCSSILGEVYSFYTIITWWDIILHTLTGFLVASLCISFFKNYNSYFNLRPLLVAIFSFCFSMTVSISWEFLEYACDKYLNFDGQKDTIIDNISSIKLDGSKNSKPVTINDIYKTILYNDDNKILTVINGGYLDIGLNDTMTDLLANFIGALGCSLSAYLFAKKEIL